jgi:programmed cell death 6-interacting protein
MDVLDAAVEDGAATPEILVAKYRGFQDVLQKAAGSDHVTAKLWDEWEDYIMDLTQDEVSSVATRVTPGRLNTQQAALEAQVPSTTMSAATSNRETKSHSRALRRSLEALDDLKRVRDDAVRRANQLADADDIQGRIAREAAGVARWAEVTPAMFEDSMQEELFKFEKFRKDIDLTVEKQQALLADIKVRPWRSLYTCLFSICSVRSINQRSCSPGRKIRPSKSANVSCNTWT